jgi:hypothetical protein
MRHLLRLLPVAAALVLVALLPAAASAKTVCGKPRGYRHGFYAYAGITKVRHVSCKTAWTVVNAYGRCRAHHRHCASAARYRTHEKIIDRIPTQFDANVHATRGARVINFYYQHNST